DLAGDRSGLARVAAYGAADRVDEAVLDRPDRPGRQLLVSQAGDEARERFGSLFHESCPRESFPDLEMGVSWGVAKSTHIIAHEDPNRQSQRAPGATGESL